MSTEMQDLLCQMDTDQSSAHELRLHFCHQMIAADRRTVIVSDLPRSRLPRSRSAFLAVNSLHVKIFIYATL